MKMNDKVIVAFLASMGMFTTKCAAAYVANLSDGDKVAFVELARDNGAEIVFADGSPQVIPVPDRTKKNASR